MNIQHVRIGNGPMRVLKTKIPVDDQWHKTEIGTGIVHLGHQEEGFVTVWFIDKPGENWSPLHLRVFGTGHEIEDMPREPNALIGVPPTYLGTVQAPSGLVWHLVGAK